jgi:predicted SnoaL-like aldol condensation-catalyzing enzyme
MRRMILGGVLAFGAQALTACASQSPEEQASTWVVISAHPDPIAALGSDDPQLAANKRLAFDMWRSIVNAGNVELADDMLTQDYTQHSPVIPTGREAFKQVFSALPHLDEIPEVVAPPLVQILGEGDLVAMVLREQMPAPPGEDPYFTAHFNLFRVADGRLAEHWHSVQGVPGPQTPAPEDGGPQPVTGATGSAQAELLQAADAALAANKKLVFDYWRAAVSQGVEGAAPNYRAADYVEHSANGTTFTPEAGGGVADAPLVAMVAEGDLVVQVLALSHPHPLRAGATYTTTWFDMFRITDGKIVEHWDGAVRPGTPAPSYGG